MLHCKLGLEAVVDPVPCPYAATLSAQVAALSARLQAVAGELQELLSSTAEGQAGAQQLSMVALRLQQDEVSCKYSLRCLTFLLELQCLDVTQV